MLRVYNWMTSGLLLTGVVAYGIANTSAIDALLPAGADAERPDAPPSGLAFIAMLAPLAFVMVLSFGINRMSRTTAQTLFWVFAARWVPA